MKRLTLIRHAKSSWDHPHLDDKLRPLALRGEKAALLMGKMSDEILRSVDYFFVSDAARASQTMELMARQAKIDPALVNYFSKLYSFEKETLVKFVRKLDDQYQSVALVGHNPALTELANYHLPDRIANLPTGAIIRIAFDCDEWAELENVDAKLTYFDCPHNYQ